MACGLQGEKVKGNGGFLDTAFVGGVVAVAKRVASTTTSSPVLHRQDERGEPKVGQDEAQRHNVAASGLEERCDDDKGVDDKGEDGLKRRHGVS